MQKGKEGSKAYAQNWETNVTLETHDPIARATAMLEQGKQTDGTQVSCMERLQLGEPT